VVVALGIGGPTERVEARLGAHPDAVRIGKPQRRGDHDACAAQRMTGDLADQMQTDGGGERDIAIDHRRGLQPGGNERGVVHKARAIVGEHLHSLGEIRRDAAGIEKGEGFDQHEASQCGAIGREEREHERPYATSRAADGGQ